MESRLGILSAESHIYKEQHAKGLELLALMEEDFLGRHPSRTTTPAGRPEYADCPIDFNISHTKNLVICTMAGGGTGCDIELASRKVNLAVAEKFFHQEEKDYLAGAQTQEESRKRFLTLWVLKEAHIKLLGTTIGAVKETPSFSIEGNSILCRTDSSIYYSLYEGGEYVMAAAFENKNERDGLIIKKYGDVPDFVLTAVN